MKRKAAFKSPKLENIAVIGPLTDYFQAGLIHRHSVLPWVGDVQCILLAAHFFPLLIHY